MKKFLAILLASLMLLSLVACGGNNDTETETETEEFVELAYSSAEQLLNQILTAYNATATEETKLSLFGGNIYNIDTVNQEGPGKFIPMADEDYNSLLGVPATEASKIDDVASMFHKQNPNMFQTYALHYKNSADLEAAVQTLKTNISAREWSCGNPDKVGIIKAPGNYLVVVWGVVDFGGVYTQVAQSIIASVEGASMAVEFDAIPM